MLAVEIRGLRNLRGRFAAMSERVLLEIQTVEAESLAKTVEEIYRHYAPRSRGHSASGLHFFEGIHGRAVTTLATRSGFQVNLSTDNPQLRGWLKHGTGIYGPRGQRIYPQRAKALGPIFNWIPMGTGPFWFASIAGMPPNPWEERAAVEARVLAASVGSRIGVRMTRYLAHGV